MIVGSGIASITAVVKVKAIQTSMENILKYMWLKKRVKSYQECTACFSLKSHEHSRHSIHVTINLWGFKAPRCSGSTNLKLFRSNGMYHTGKATNHLIQPHVDILPKAPPGLNFLRIYMLWSTGKPVRYRLHRGN